MRAAVGVAREVLAAWWSSGMILALGARSRFRSPAGPVFCIGPHHQSQINRAHCGEAAHDGFCFLSGAYHRLLVWAATMSGVLLLVAPVSGPRYLLVRCVDHP
ncbi:hypothetical protein PC120_g28279 [Phytophthora cactorum]|nr:hypothetical protein PC120_g28279 [Phytophthora cactorum]